MPRQPSFTDEELLLAIQDFARRHGTPPRVDDMGPEREHNLPSSGTLARRFGSFSAAIEAAGFPRPRRGRRPRQS